jgi:hypothetical protein
MKIKTFFVLMILYGNECGCAHNALTEAVFGSRILRSVLGGENLDYRELLKRREEARARIEGKVVVEGAGSLLLTKHPLNHSAVNNEERLKKEADLRPIGCCGSASGTRGVKRNFSQAREDGTMYDAVQVTSQQAESPQLLILDKAQGSS